MIETFTAADPANHTARLSAQGVKMACALQPFSVASLALWLYLFNRYPAFPKWHSRFRSNTDDDSLLGVDLGTAVSGKDWRRVSLDEQANDWHVWSRRVDSKSVNQPSKLYVSMNCNDLVSILPKLARVLSDAEASSFKIGRHIYALLRPDKMVAYFPNLQQLECAANEIACLVRGCRPHGVPFTGQLDNDGILSYGIDPQKHMEGEPSTWRLDIAQRLAGAMYSAQLDPSCPVEPDEFALARLTLAGFDTSNWMPNSNQ